MAQIDKTIQVSYCIIQKKKDPEIVSFQTQKNIEDAYEFIKKVNFYLPEIKKIYDSTPAEYYPRRPLYAFNSPCDLCDYAALCIQGDTEQYSLGYDATEKKYRKPYVSPTEIIKYETCPRQWAYYKSGITTPVRSAATECGSSIHVGIYNYLLTGQDPVIAFRESWEEVALNPHIKYGQRDTHKSLEDIAIAGLKKFPKFWESWGLTVECLEKAHTVDAGDFILKVKPDAVASKDGKTVVIDWKFTAVAYNPLWVAISDQLTAAAAVILLQEDL